MKLGVASGAWKTRDCLCGPATLMRKCAPATQAGLSTYECMDHQGRLLALWRIASHSLQWKCIHTQETIYAQEEEREYPNYDGKIKRGDGGRIVTALGALSARGLGKARRRRSVSGRRRASSQFLAVSRLERRRWPRHDPLRILTPRYFTTS
jgi:hypothetical protein